jgi:hypothetical protein
MKPLGTKMLETASGSVTAAGAASDPAPEPEELLPLDPDVEPTDPLPVVSTEASRSGGPLALPGPETLLEHAPTNDSHAATSGTFDLMMTSCEPRP